MSRVLVISAALLIVLGLAASQPAQAQTRPQQLDGYFETFGPAYAPPGNPVAGDTLHEIYPFWSRRWEILEWTKTAGYSGRSVLRRVGTPLSTGHSYFTDIIVMTVVDSTTNVDTTAFEYTGTFGPVSGIIPVGSRWHELYPTFSREWKILVWIDNGNGYLDYCDYLVIALGSDFTTLKLVHVIRVVTGAKVTEPVPSLSSWGIGILVALLAISAVWFIIRRRRLASLAA